MLWPYVELLSWKVVRRASTTLPLRLVMVRLVWPMKLSKMTTGLYE